MLCSRGSIAQSCFSDRDAVSSFGPVPSTCHEYRALAPNEDFASMYVIDSAIRTYDFHDDIP